MHIPTETVTEFARDLCMMLCSSNDVTSQASQNLEIRGQSCCPLRCFEHVAGPMQSQKLQNRYEGIYHQSGITILGEASLHWLQEQHLQKMSF